MQNFLVAETAKEMWDRLFSIHERSTETQASIEPTVSRVHDESSRYHISKVQNLARQLIDLGESIPNLVIISKILATLPPKYRHFRTAWGIMEEKRQTFDLL